MILKVFWISILKKYILIKNLKTQLFSLINKAVSGAIFKRSDIQNCPNNSICVPIWSCSLIVKKYYLLSMAKNISQTKSFENFRLNLFCNFIFGILRWTGKIWLLVET